MEIQLESLGLVGKAWASLASHKCHWKMSFCSLKSWPWIVFNVDKPIESQIIWNGNQLNFTSYWISKPLNLTLVSLKSIECQRTEPESALISKQLKNLASLNWIPNRLKVKSVESQINWIFKQLNFKPIDLRISWASNRMTSKPKAAHKKLNLRSLEFETFWIWRQLNFKSVQSRTKWISHFCPLGFWFLEASTTASCDTHVSCTYNIWTAQGGGGSFQT